MNSVSEGKPVGYAYSFDPTATYHWHGPGAVGCADTAGRAESGLFQSAEVLDARLDVVIEAL
ncbi:hypothetical protein EDD99_4042 [Streptomyces sp. 846.5]|nr:hypothetical protein [Streptomyces sp. 846.5]TDU05526.1 hypothetical protein EDD99_4042 [Streptomyces sp. 846.5]